ncbi:hypothetical protein [Sulfuricurvum sp.]|uniref:hypothetical protein n=1 Tax=Sulfuricurvum sp. TaxID=2025608 RepID=UPI0026323304|nr:hypothetical protein [Sulfuricurvum sp.]MDD3594816.1 hypothetical protein [Sulfuricurvum sp.]
MEHIHRLMSKEEINEEIRKADFRGESKEEIKPLYIKRNTFGISDDITEIYRIFQAEFFLQDVKNSEISLVHIHPLVFNDSYENPLLNKAFYTEEGNLVTLNGIVENFFGLSWTEEKEDEGWRWKEFTHGEYGVRVQVSLPEFLEELFNTEDDFFMLHYFIGKVSYYDSSEIEKWISESHYTNFLDSLGHASALSLTALRNDFEDEKEIRILYEYRPSDNNFAKNIVQITKKLHPICKHPFNWNAVVKEVLLDPRLNDTQFVEYKQALERAGVKCSIERSKVKI